MRFGIYTSDSFDQKPAGEGESEKELDFLDRSILDGDVHFVEILQELGRLLPPQFKGLGCSHGSSQMKQPIPDRRAKLLYQIHGLLR
ncbi:hypothetical protein [Pseudorhizobium flavum]|uniref:hypothetical protein n=1 Tax=Pseudorhizobium flavum TaxID=1335061 RepID=UPI0009873AB5|nr:hypothetical protein [Pseudorhizobium flavum]